MKPNFSREKWKPDNGIASSLVLYENNCYPRILYPAIFKNKNEESFRVIIMQLSALVDGVYVICPFHCNICPP